LAPRTWSATVIMPTATVDPKGNFDIAGVVPGNYVLMGNMSIADPAAPPPDPARGAPSPPRGGGAGGGGNPPVRQIPLTGYMPMDVGSGSMENVQFQLVAGVNVT